MLLSGKKEKGEGRIETGTADHEVRGGFVGVRRYRRPPISLLVVDSIPPAHLPSGLRCCDRRSTTMRTRECRLIKGSGDDEISPRFQPTTSQH